MTNSENDVALTGSELDNDNAILISDGRIEEAKRLILEAIVELSKQEKLTAKETEYLLQLIDKVYLDKKANFFFQNKIDEMGRVLHNLFSLVNSPKRDHETTELLYYNSNKHYLKHGW